MFDVSTNAFFYVLALYFISVIWTQVNRRAPDKVEGVHYIFLALASHMCGTAHYIFFDCTVYLFGDHILPYLSYTVNKEKTARLDALGFGKTQPRYYTGMEEFA